MIKVYAVIKGYHIYKKRPKVGTELLCEPDLESTVDDYAMGVYDTHEDLVGYVPASPAALQIELHNLYKQHGMRITW